MRARGVWLDPSGGTVESRARQVGAQPVRESGDDRRTDAGPVDEEWPPVALAG